MSDGFLFGLSVQDVCNFYCLSPHSLGPCAVFFLFAVDVDFLGRTAVTALVPRHVAVGFGAAWMFWLGYALGSGQQNVGNNVTE